MEAPMSTETTTTMRAIVAHEYGDADVLVHTVVPKPRVEPDQVLIRVVASSTNPADWHMMTGTPYLVRPTAGWRAPKSPKQGSDVAGVVEEIGSEITKFEVGDAVFGNARGAFAEFVTGKEEYLTHKPANVSFEAAATMGIAGHTALQGLRDHGHVKSGDRVLVNGASGGVGTFAVQMAKAMGAHVTAICSTRHVETMQSIGADRIVDYTTTDIAEIGEQFDVILDNVGNRTPSTMRKLLVPGGRWVIVSGPKKSNWWGPLPYVARSLASFLFGSRKAAMFVASENAADLRVMAEMLENGQVVPVIDRRFRLDQASDALRYLGEGHSKGKSVIVVEGE